MRSIIVLLISAHISLAHAMELQISAANAHQDACLDALSIIHQGLVAGNNQQTMASNKGREGIKFFTEFTQQAEKIFDQYGIAAVKAVANTLALSCSKKHIAPIHEHIARAIANHIFDHDALGMLLLNQTDASEMVILEIDDSQDGSDTQLLIKQNNILHKFVRAHCTSVALVAREYPELIAASKRKFCINRVGIRSLDGLEEVVQRYYSPDTKKSVANVIQVSIAHNNIQTLSIDRFKKIFPGASDIHAEGNPLSFVNLTGAHIGDTIHAQALRGSNCIIDLESLSTISPINLHIAADSITVEHRAALNELVANLSKKNTYKHVAIKAVKVAIPSVLGALVSVMPWWPFENIVIQASAGVVGAVSTVGIGVHFYCYASGPDIKAGHGDWYKPHNICFE